MVLEEQDFTDINAFSLAYRWTNNSYWKASKTELEKIRPIFPDTAKRLWDNLYQKTLGEKPKSSIVEMLVTTQVNVCRTEENQTHVVQWLTSHLPDKSGQIIIFWDPRKAVLTQKSLFVLHWDDFCYPSSDDVMVCPLNGNWLLYYDHGENFYFKQI